MNFNNMRLATKLWLSTGAIVLGLGLIIAFAAVRNAGDRAESTAKLEVASQKIRLVGQWAALTEVNAVRSLAVAMTSDPAVVNGFKDDIAATSAQISDIQKKVDAMELSAADRAQLQKIAANRKTMLDLRVQGNQLKVDQNFDALATLMTAQYRPAVLAYQQSQKDFVAMQEAAFEDIRQHYAQRSKNTVTFAAAGVALLIVVLLAGSATLIRSIRTPLLQANDLAARIAQGDLSQQMDLTRGDEFGDLMKSLAAMNESLGRMVSQVRRSTDSIATASAEIATGNNDLAQRTEQTSSNLQATASSMDHLTSNVQQSADNARQASSLAARASSVAEKGGTVVEQVVSTMQEINTSSQKIADIIGVIDGIAFQTNILALNAAVEAARAGEQGRGFAVVATEVRSLAGRSAEAAKEIKNLIGTSVEKVESGARLVADAGSTMRDIVESVQRVTAVIGEITGAATEQSSGIAQVNQAIGNLDQMTQQNAALVEESAAAAQSLREQADRMKEAVAVFKVLSRHDDPGHPGATLALPRA
jgi:methyl-accepting chemotaxis protein